MRQLSGDLLGGDVKLISPTAGHNYSKNQLTTGCDIVVNLLDSLLDQDYEKNRLVHANENLNRFQVRPAATLVEQQEEENESTDEGENTSSFEDAGRTSQFDSLRVFDY